MPLERQADDAPLVGRDIALGQLHLVWEGVSHKSRPHLVTVFGPPGNGKTRLVRALSALVEGDGGRTLRGRSLPYGESTGYGAFGQQVKELAGILETDSTPLAREKLDHAAASLCAAEDVPAVTSHLAILLLTAEGAADRETLFRTARRFAEALARARPTALIFEDIQWADPSLLDLLEDLERVPDVPLLLLALARPELAEKREGWAGTWQRRHRYLALPLEPLTPEESRELALHLLAQRARPVAHDVAERLTATAEGNPLFIEELAASLVEHATESAAQLPTTVRRSSRRASTRCRTTSGR